MNKIDASKPVWRVTFLRTDGRRETQFFNAYDRLDAEIKSNIISGGQPYDPPYEIDPATGYRK